MDPIRPGDPRQVGGYRLLGRLGAGGMGVVYLGRSPAGRPVAVKIIKERYAADAVFRARFRREVAAARTVTGAFTAPILDADPDAAMPWLVTAYLPGLTLREAVGTFGALPAVPARVLAMGLAEALADIHRAGLAHRDLKPGNIMLTADGPRVIDFGIARPDGGTAITKVGAVLGTPGFMSPEQASGGVAGPESDVFSFGAVLAYAATGREPFGRGDAATMRRRVAEARADLGGVTDLGLAGLIAACLRRDPGERPSAVQILDMLDRIGEDAPPSPDHGTGWLPAALAEAIDRRAAEVRPEVWPEARPEVRPEERLAKPLAGDALHVLDAETDEPETADPAAGREQSQREHATASDGAPADDTSPPTPPSRPGMPQQLSRRALVVSAPLALAAIGAVAVVRARDTESPRASARRSPKGSSPTPPPQGVLRWKAKVSDYYPKVSIAGGVVVAEGQENDVRALDVQTGKTLWKEHAGNGSHAFGDSVYLSNPIQPWLTAVDAATGRTRWEGNYREGTVHMVISGPVACFGYEGPIRAVGVRDGRTRWVADVSPETGLAADSALVAAVNKTEVVGLDPRSGRKRWAHPLDLRDYLTYAFLVGDGFVFVGDREGVLHALRAADGTLAWRKGRGPTWFNGSSLISSGGVLYADGGHGSVVAIDPATGAERWSRFLDDDSELALAGGTLFAACSHTGTLYALNAADGRILWTHKAQIDRDPVIASTAGLVFVGTRAGTVEAVAPPDGGPRAGS
ncbi:serine/threonine-protein kinase [Actinomadura sp. 3N508]|uniref:serine/threonine-protein kinase n=1 Tax=Actinomadura sp. 3N508 TaxID=3375153 RepID=UPI00378E483E